MRLNIASTEATDATAARDALIEQDRRSSSAASTGTGGSAGTGEPGRVGSSLATTPVTGISAETVTDTVTFTATAGRRYRATALFQWDGDTAGDEAYFRFRWQAGSSVTTAGTQFAIARVTSLGTTPSNPRMSMHLVRDVTGIGAGTATIGLTVARAQGTGSISREGAADNECFLVVDDVGT